MIFYLNIITNYPANDADRDYKHFDINYTSTYILNERWYIFLRIKESHVSYRLHLFDKCTNNIVEVYIKYTTGIESGFHTNISISGRLKESTLVEAVERFVNQCEVTSVDKGYINSQILHGNLATYKLGDKVTHNDKQYVCKGETKMKAGIKSVTVNEKKRIVTVVFNDGDIRMSKAHKDDKFDVEVGIAMCLAYKYMNMSKTQYHKAVAKYTDQKVSK